MGWKILIAFLAGGGTLVVIAFRLALVFTEPPFQ
jgi:hypothetical protein